MNQSRSEIRRLAVQDPLGTAAKVIALQARVTKLENELKCAEVTLLKCGCQFWACDGPDAPFESMKTCICCAGVQNIRAILAVPNDIKEQES